MSQTNITDNSGQAFVSRRQRQATVTIFDGENICVIYPVKWEHRISNSRPNNGVTDSSKTSVTIELRDFKNIHGDIKNINFDAENIVVAKGDNRDVSNRDEIKTVNFAVNAVEKVEDLNGKVVVIKLTN